MHFAEDSKSVIIPATCTTNETATTYCFCNKEIETVNIENTVLGHNHSDFLGLIYENYSNDGYYSYKCERCDDVNNDKVAPALFKCLGYSAPEDGRGGIAIGFIVNNTAIREYEEATGKKISYGVFAVAQSKLGTNDIFGTDGKAANGVINAEITSYEFSAFELKIDGFEEKHKSALLALGAYVITTDGENTEYSYIQEGKPAENEKYAFTSYNAIANAPSEDE